jgi:hypothetical protein
VGWDEEREDLSQRGRDISILSYPLDGRMDGWIVGTKMLKKI